MKLRLAFFLLCLAALAWWMLTGETEVANDSVSVGFGYWTYLIVAGIATVAILGIAIWQRAKIIPFSKAHPKIALFVVWTIFLYIAAVTLHPELRPWLLTPTGFGLLMLLVAMVVILCLGVEILKSSWLTVLAFVLLTIAIVDPGIMHQVPPEYLAKFGPGARDSSSSTSTTIARICPGIKTEHSFGTAPEKINPAGQCAVNLWIPEGNCIYEKASGNPRVYGPICPGTNVVTGPNDAEYVWSAGAPFTGYFALPSPRYARR